MLVEKIQKYTDIEYEKRYKYFIGTVRGRT